MEHFYVKQNFWCQFLTLNLSYPIVARKSYLNLSLCLTLDTGGILIEQIQVILSYIKSSHQDYSDGGWVSWGDDKAVGVDEKLRGSYPLRNLQSGPA